jgi:hypothetical protein
MSNLTFFQNIDPTTYYSTNVDFNNIEKYFNYLDKKNRWDKQTAKNNINKLYEFKKLALEKNNTKYNDKIEHYIAFLTYVLSDLNSLQDNIFSMIGTIFIPLSFIVGFFGMNFESMGVPSLKKGIFTIKHAQHKLASIFFIIIFFTIMIYINFLKVF